MYKNILIYLIYAADLWLNNTLWHNLQEITDIKIKLYLDVHCKISKVCSIDCLSRGNLGRSKNKHFK